MNPISNQLGIANSYSTFERTPNAIQAAQIQKTGSVECSTCAQRSYQDRSSDSGVSFQTPTHINPASSFSAVRGHEQEHVIREQANAKKNGGKVIAQSVSIYTSICPECGRSYSSGGLTRTTTSVKQESAYKGNMIDISI